MQAKEKVLICAFPYLAGGALWFALTNPAFMAAQDKNNELAEKKKEHVELTTKLAELARLEKEHKSLEEDIQHLRNSVPKSPDLDLFLVDFEKMCLELGMDIISIESPEREKQKLSESVEQEVLSLSGGSAINALGAIKDQVTPGPKAAKTPQKAKVGPEADIGLSKLVKQVTVTGDYPNFLELMRKLESYQRVIGINQVEAEIPPEVGKGKIQDVRNLVVSFLMTAYYLP
ncbi:MAG: hypothetical protein HY711_03130 [Candidatus Melainabacteria bacterium]|nr:hypothetical protein [Candidatus Melainabacteria bacterium]